MAVNLGPIWPRPLRRRHRVRFLGEGCEWVGTAYGGAQSRGKAVWGSGVRRGSMGLGYREKWSTLALHPEITMRQATG